MLYPKIRLLKVKFTQCSVLATLAAVLLATPVQASEHKNEHKAHNNKVAAHQASSHASTSNAPMEFAHRATHKSKSFFKETLHSLTRLYELVLGEYINGFWTKLDHIQKVDEQNERLIKKIATLELENATMKKKVVERTEKTRSQSIKRHALAEGGVPEARTIASLRTADPQLLSATPRKIHDGAMAAFVEEDYETAAKAFLHLTESPETTDYNTAESHFFAALSLYNLGNYKQALIQFEQAQAQAKGEEIAYAPRAMAWVAVCQKKLGRSVAGQKTVKSLIEKFPRSKEAQRLNRNE